MEKQSNKMKWQADESAYDSHDPVVAAYVNTGKLEANLSSKSIKIAMWFFCGLMLALLVIPTLYQSDFVISYLPKDLISTPQIKNAAIKESLLKIQEISQNKSLDVDQKNIEIDELINDVFLQEKAVNRYIDIDSSKTTHQQQLEILKKLNAENSFDQLKKQVGLLLESDAFSDGFIASSKRSLRAFEHTILSQDYLRKWEDDLNKSSIILAGLQKKWIQFLYFAFNDMGSKGVAGKKGWSFYKPSVEYAYMPWITDWRAKAEDPIPAIIDFQKQLKNKNIELLVVVVPNKESIYPDYLSSWAAKELSSYVSHGRFAINEMRKNGIEVVDLFTEFKNYRDTRTVQDDLYLMEDTHWNSVGLEIAAKKTATIIKNSIWYKSKEQALYTTKKTTVVREGDIPIMSLVAPAKQMVYVNQVYKNQYDEAGLVVKTTLYQDDFKNSEILIIGDSFSRIFQTDSPRSAGWIAHLAKELNAPLASIVSDGGASTLVREKLARKANVLKRKKLVVWEFVERDLRFGAEGWKKISF